MIHKELLANENPTTKAVNQVLRKVKHFPFH